MCFQNVDLNDIDDDALHQNMELVANEIMSRKVKFSSLFTFCDEKIDVTAFVTLAPSLKAKSDDIILSSRINRQYVTIINNVIL